MAKRRGGSRGKAKAKAVARRPAPKPAARRKPTPKKPAARKPAPKPAPRRPAPKPAARRPAPKPAPRRPAPQPVARRPAPKPAARRPTPTPAARRPAPKPTARRPAPQPAAKRPTQSRPASRKPTVSKSNPFGRVQAGSGARSPQSVAKSTNRVQQAVAKASQAKKRTSGQRIQGAINRSDVGKRMSPGEAKLVAHRAGVTAGRLSKYLNNNQKGHVAGKGTQKFLAEDPNQKFKAPTGLKIDRHIRRGDYGKKISAREAAQIGAKTGVSGKRLGKYFENNQDKHKLHDGTQDFLSSYGKKKFGKEMGSRKGFNQFQKANQPQKPVQNQNLPDKGKGKGKPELPANGNPFDTGDYGYEEYGYDFGQPAYEEFYEQPAYEMPQASGSNAAANLTRFDPFGAMARMRADNINPFGGKAQSTGMFNNSNDFRSRQQVKNHLNN